MFGINNSEIGYRFGDRSQNGEKNVVSSLKQIWRKNGARF